MTDGAQYVEEEENGGNRDIGMNIRNAAETGILRGIWWALWFHHLDFARKY